MSMFYYAIKLDDESKELAIIVTPYGKFQYCHLAMRLSVAGDEAQAIIEEVLRKEDVDAYLDDVGLFTKGTFSQHMVLLDRILQCLKKSGLKINPEKCEWDVQETDFLGHWLTPSGMKPWNK
eukprot:6980339-Ditylum_brightwellii.AAC.1